MENKDPQSWSSAHMHHSQWLQTTISDLDEKLKAMMTILEGSKCPNQGHMHCKWREDLIQMLEQFGRSNRVLAIAFNQLKSKASHGTFHSGSFSKTICASCNTRTTGNLEDKKLEDGCNRHLKSLTDHSDVKFDCTNLDFDLLKLVLERNETQIEDEMPDFPTNEDILMKIEGLEVKQRNEDPSMMDSKFESLWSTLKYEMTKLTEDNLHQMVELAQRNDEKRETIRRLQLEVETLKRENKALQISVRHSNADSECSSQSQISRPRRLSMGKFFGGCSS